MKCKFPTARMQGDTGPLDEDKCTVGVTCPDLANSSIPILPAMVSYIHQGLSVVTGGDWDLVKQLLWNETGRWRCFGSRRLHSDAGPWIG